MPPAVTVQAGRRPAPAVRVPPAGTSRSSAGHDGRGRRTGPAAGLRRPRRPDTTPAGCGPRRCGEVAQPPEHLPGAGVDQPGAGRGDEEARRGGLRAEPVADPGVTAERVEGGAQDRHHAGLAELRFPDHQHRVGPVDVSAVEPDRFSDPHAGDGQQPDQRLVRGRRHRRQLPGLGHQGLDVAGTADERRPPAAAAGDQSWRRYLGAGIDAGQVAGEAAGDRHPPRRDAGGRVDAGSLRPGQRRGHGDGRQVLGLQERHQPG